MKRILLFVVCLLTVFSCEDGGNGTGVSAENPLSEIVLPETVCAGGEVIVQWNGFPEDAAIVLLSADGSEYETILRVVTASGLSFIVPASVPAGIYTVMLAGDRNLELGTMEVTPAGIPVTDVKVPSGVVRGNELFIGGIGFEDGCSVMLADAGGDEFTLATDVVHDGISVLVPADMRRGEYVLYLLQDGGRWVLSPSFIVYSGSSVKTLQRIDYYCPYVGSAMLRLSWEIEPDDPVTLTVSQYLLDGEEESLMAYDRYVCGDNGFFSLEHDGFEESNDQGMSYVRDEDGVVRLADVLVFGDEETTPFTWTYDAEGFLTDISSPSRSFRTLSYKDGNLVAFRNHDFTYADTSLSSHPSAPDVVWGYMAVMEKNDPFIYFPYLLGWYTKASACLPTSMSAPSPTGNGKVTHALKYVFDEEGYVTKMSWDSDRVEYVYNNY